jgi:hypothetical protein
MGQAHRQNPLAKQYLGSALLSEILKTKPDLHKGSGTLSACDKWRGMVPGKF